MLTPSLSPPPPSSSSSSKPAHKRQRTSSSAIPVLTNEDYERQKRASTQRLLDVWAGLEKYVKPLDEDDIIDLQTNEIIKDRGVLRAEMSREIGFFADEGKPPDGNSKEGDAVTDEKEGDEGEGEDDEEAETEGEQEDADELNLGAAVPKLPPVPAMSEEEIQEFLLAEEKHKASHKYEDYEIDLPERSSDQANTVGEECSSDELDEWDPGADWNFVRPVKPSTPGPLSSQGMRQLHTPPPSHTSQATPPRATPSALIPPRTAPSQRTTKADTPNASVPRLDLKRISSTSSLKSNPTSTIPKRSLSKPKSTSLLVDPEVIELTSSSEDEIDALPPSSAPVPSSPPVNDQYGRSNFDPRKSTQKPQGRRKLRSLSPLALQTQISPQKMSIAPQSHPTSPPYTPSKTSIRSKSVTSREEFQSVASSSRMPPPPVPQYSPQKRKRVESSGSSDAASNSITLDSGSKENSNRRSEAKTDPNRERVSMSVPRSSKGRGKERELSYDTPSSPTSWSRHDRNDSIDNDVHSDFDFATMDQHDRYHFSQALRHLSLLRSGRDPPTTPHLSSRTASRHRSSSPHSESASHSVPPHFDFSDRFSSEVGSSLPPSSPPPVTSDAESDDSSWIIHKPPRRDDASSSRAPSIPPSPRMKSSRDISFVEKTTKAMERPGFVQRSHDKHRGRGRGRG